MTSPNGAPDAAQALLAVKSLGKTPTGSRVISKQSNMVTLLAIHKALDSDAEASNEALRCVANAMLLIEEARITFVSRAVGGGQAMVTLLEVSQDRIRSGAPAQSSFTALTWSREDLPRFSDSIPCLSFYDVCVGFHCQPCRA